MYLPTASESGMEDMESEEEPGSEIGELGRQVGQPLAVESFRRRLS